MKILVLSDLHLSGYDIALDEEYVSIDRLDTYLSENLKSHFFRSDIDFIVINGDLLEMFQTFFNKKKLFKKINSMYPETFEYLNNKDNRLYLISGNHDLGMLSNFKVPVNDTLIIDQVYFEHGDKYDELYKSSFARKISSFFTKVLYFLEKIIGILIDIKLTKYWQDYLRSKRVTTDIHKNKALSLLADNKDLKGVVFGHTHIPFEIRLSEGRFYLNTGTYLKGDKYIIDSIRKRGLLFLYFL